jgi:uncharacterized membrane protein
MPGGNYPNYAYAVSGDGGVVAGSTLNPIDRSAFRWTPAEQMQPLDGMLPELFASEALAVSEDGTAIAGFRRDLAFNRVEAFLWRKVGGTIGLGWLPGGTSSTAHGLSKDGSVVVGGVEYGLSSGEGFRWRAEEGMLGIGDLPGGAPRSLATAVSADGTIVVGVANYDPAGGPQGQAFRWTESNKQLTGLGFLPGTTSSFAWCISGDGSVIVGHAASQAAFRRPFRWTEAGGMVELGHLSMVLPDSAAYAASSDGLVVVGVSRGPSTVQEAVIWDEVHGIRSIREVLTGRYGMNLDGWLLLAAWGVSTDGSTIVGIGLDPQGGQQGWRAVLPPSGDMNGDGVTDAGDIPPFLEAVVTGSTLPADRIRGDFNRNARLDGEDVPGMVPALLRP